MSDNFGLNRAREQGLELGSVGQEVVLDNDLVRVWAIRLEPGDSQAFHLHRHPYLVVSLQGDANQVETIFGETRETFEPTGNVVYRGDQGPVHRLTNKSNQIYECRLIELKSREWNFE